MEAQQELANGKANGKTTNGKSKSKKKEETQAVMSLNQRLALVRGEIGRIRKDGNNEFHNYTYMSADQVKAVVGDALQHNGVVFAMSMLGVKSEVIKTKKGDAMRVICEFEMRFMSTDNPDDRLVLCWFAEGQDSGDKAINKAATAALKYFLVDNLLLASGEQDPDSLSPSIEGSRTATAIESLKSAAAECGYTWEQVEAVCMHRYRNPSSALNVRDLAKVEQSMRQKHQSQNAGDRLAQQMEQQQ